MPSGSTRGSYSNKKLERDDDSKKSHPALGWQEFVPDRLIAERGDKCPMREPVFFGNPRRERRLTLPLRHLAKPARPHLTGLGCQDQLRLPRPDQIDIDL